MLDSTDLLVIKLALEREVEFYTEYLHSEHLYSEHEGVVDSAKNNLKRVENTLEKIKRMEEK